MAKKKHSAIGMAALAAGAGAAAIASISRQKQQSANTHADPNYRNTERGKHEKNSNLQHVERTSSSILVSFIQENPPIA